MSKLGKKVGQIDIHKRKSFLERVGDFVGGVILFIVGLAVFVNLVG